MKLTVTEWERVLKALAAHDFTIRQRIVAQMRRNADEEHRTPMVSPWE